MDLLDLLTQIERYISTRGLSHSDSINELTEALAEDYENS